MARGVARVSWLSQTLVNHAQVDVEATYKFQKATISQPQMPSNMCSKQTSQQVDTCTSGGDKPADSSRPSRKSTAFSLLLGAAHQAALENFIPHTSEGLLMNQTAASREGFIGNAVSVHSAHC